VKLTRPAFAGFVF